MKLSRVFSTVVLALLFSVPAGAQENKQSGQTSSSSAAAGDAPKLVIESLTHDFGEVKAGTPLRYAFKIKNEGKADLLINSVTPG